MATGTTPHYPLPKPSEQKEQSRLELQHRIWLLTLDGALTAPRVPQCPPSASILDVGCGSGGWAAAYAREHPDASVLAFDINPPSMASKPSNLEIMGSDAEKDWPFDRTFDLIHVRMMTLAIRDWPRLFERCWRHLNPGGWIEVNDTSAIWEAEDPTANCHNSMFLRLGLLMLQGTSRSGVDKATASHHVDRLKLLGFSYVHQDRVKWPLNGLWPSEPRLKELGQMVSEDWNIMARAATPRILGDVLGLGPSDVSEILEGALTETNNDREKKFNFPLFVTVARKPAAAE